MCRGATTNFESNDASEIDRQAKLKDTAVYSASDEERGSAFSGPVFEDEPEGVYYGQQQPPQTPGSDYDGGLPIAELDDVLIIAFDDFMGHWKQEPIVAHIENQETWNDPIRRRSSGGIGPRPPPKGLYSVR